MGTEGSQGGAPRGGLEERQKGGRAQGQIRSLESHYYTLSCREDPALGMVVVVSKATSTPLSDSAPHVPGLLHFLCLY